MRHGFPASNLPFAVLLLGLLMSACGGGGENLMAPPGPAPVASVTVSPSTAALPAGSSTALTVVVRDAAGNTLSGRTVTWTTDKASVVVVSDAGLVTGIAPGSGTITATSEGQAGSATITVQPVAVGSVSVNPPSASLGIGATLLLAAVVRDAANNPLGGRAVTWAVSNSAVATISPAGLVSAVGEGTTTATATVEGHSGAATITVTGVAVATVVVAPSELALVAGNTALLEAIAYDASGNVLAGRTFSWSTDNAAVATGVFVGGQAAIVGVGPGVAVITATSEGQSGSATIVVVAPTTDLCAQIAGALVFADDGQYLGRLTNQFDTESIYNRFGPYGSEFSAVSIYNQFGKYGSQFSQFSPFNPFTTTPPILVKNGSAVAYFTVNNLLTPYVPPAFAATCTFP